MKILHVYKTYFPDPPGGVQEAIRQICLSTKSYGIENTVLTLTKNKEIDTTKRPEASIERCKSLFTLASCNFGGLDVFNRFRKLASQMDLIHYHFPWPFADLLRFVAPKKPSVITYHSDIIRQKWLSKLYSPLMWKTLSLMHAVIVTSPNYLASSPILASHRLSRKVRLIPLGLDEASYAWKENRRVFERIRLPFAAPFFLFLGALRYYKGLEYILSAARRVKACIVIAGVGPDLESLRARATSMGLDNVYFTGYVSDSEKVVLLKACLAMILPSHIRSEAFGMVLLESAMFGKPMITAEINTGTSFVNENGVTGLVVPPASSTELANAMNLFLEDRELAANFGLAARERYEKYFSASSLGAAHADLYAECVNRNDSRDENSLSI